MWKYLTPNGLPNGFLFWVAVLVPVLLACDSVDLVWRLAIIHAALVVVLFPIACDGDTKIDRQQFILVFKILSCLRMVLAIVFPLLVLRRFELLSLFNTCFQAFTPSHALLAVIVFLAASAAFMLGAWSIARKITAISSRFLLDTMPALQMGFDQKLNTGDMCQYVVERERRRVQEDASVHSSLDQIGNVYRLEFPLYVVLDLANGLCAAIASLSQTGKPSALALADASAFVTGVGILVQMPAWLLLFAVFVFQFHFHTEQLEHWASMK